MAFRFHRGEAGDVDFLFRIKVKDWVVSLGDSCRLSGVSRKCPHAFNIFATDYRSPKISSGCSMGFSCERNLVAIVCQLVVSLVIPGQVH